MWRGEGTTEGMEESGLLLAVAPLCPRAVTEARCTPVAVSLLCSLLPGCSWLPALALAPILLSSQTVPGLGSTEMLLMLSPALEGGQRILPVLSQAEIVRSKAGVTF